MILALVGFATDGDFEGAHFFTGQFAPLPWLQLAVDQGDAGAKAQLERLDTGE